MKKLIFFIAFVSLSLCLANKAEAKGIPIPFSYNSEYVNTVLDLPNDSTAVQEVNGKEVYCNIGCLYKQVWLVWIPLWNYDEQYCIEYEGEKNVCQPISKEEAEEITKTFNLELPKAQPSLWNRIGGKAIILLVIGFFVMGAVRKKN